MAHRRLLALIFLGLLMVTVQRPMIAQAATHYVSTSAELIAAMTAAQSGDVIEMATGTYQLTAVNNHTIRGATGLPVIAKNLTINGNGSTIQRVAGSPSFRIMLINSGIVVLNNLTLMGGLTSAVIEHTHGGGLYNSGALTLNNVNLVGNRTVAEGSGGGLYHRSGTLLINGGTISGNSSLAGGGVYIRATSDGSLRGVLIDGNQMFPGGTGAGIYIGQAISRSIFLERVIISNNVGHGIYLTSSSSFYLMYSRVSGNTGAVEGGGIHVSGGSASIYNSLIDNNSASSVGGGLYIQASSSAHLGSSTVSSNSATTAAGIYNAGSFDSFYSTISNSASADPRNIQNVNKVWIGGSIIYTPDGANCAGSGTYKSEYYSISNDATCGLTGSSDAQNIDPQIGPLTDNGGLFPSHALLAGSPAIDRFNITPHLKIYDTRDVRGPGYARFSGGKMDVGSFEVQQEVCPVFPVSVGTPSELSTALTCFNRVIAHGTHTIILTNDITLTANLPFVGNENPSHDIKLVIDGNGFALNGANQYRSGLLIYPQTVVTFRNIGFVNGWYRNPYSDSSSQPGGALNFMSMSRRLPSIVTMQNVFFENNSAYGSGGAIYNSGADLTITNSVFRGNNASSGGALISGARSIAISDSVFTNNIAAYGGAMYLGSGIVTLTRVTLNDNYGSSDGGAIHLREYANLTLRDSLISNNRAGNNGGGLFSWNNTSLNLINTTMSGNHGNIGGGMRLYGTGAQVILNSTIVNNTSLTGAQNISRSGGTVSIANTIISNDGVNCDEGVVVSGGYNVVSDATCGTPTTGDQFNIDPQLAPLADNGGPTLTHALLPGSPAIDAGSNAGIPSDMINDQRGAGFPRIRGAAVDVGAFETPSVVGVTLSKSSVAVTEGGATDTYTVVLDGPPYADVVVSLSGSTQVSVSPNTLTFTPTNWNTPQTVTVTAIDDRVVEGDHAAAISHTVSSTDVNYHAFSVPSAAVSVTDNDSATYTITDASAQLSSSGPESVTTITLRIAVEASGTGTGDWDFALPFDVGFSATGGTAIGGGVDYDLSSASASFTTGMTFTDAGSTGVTFREVTLTVINDGIDEDDETIVVTVADDETGTSSGYDLLINPTEIRDYTYTILDDDTAGVIVSPATVEVSESGLTDSYTVVLTSQPTADVTVNLISDAQVTTSPTTLTFTSADWNIPQTVTVTAVDDSIAENDHTGSVGHSITSADTVYNGIAAAPVTANISDNDGVAVIISTNTLELTEGGDSATYTLVLGSQPSADVVITPYDFDEISVSPMSVTFTPANWNIPQIVTVSAIDDDDFEGPQTDIIMHKIESADLTYAGLSIPLITVNLTDNDEPTNLIANPGFEDFSEAPKQPAFWVGRSLTRYDRRLCTSQATFSGSCGFQFKPDGNPMTARRELRQRNASIPWSADYEVLVFSAQVRANNVPSGARVMIVVHYNDGSGRVDRLVVPIEGGTYGYSEIGGTLELYTGSISHIVTRIRVGNRAGRLRIDDLFLALVPESTLDTVRDEPRSEEGLFTLPEAPNDLSGEN